MAMNMILLLKSFTRTLGLKNLLYPVYSHTLLKVYKRRQNRLFNGGNKELLFLVDDVLTRHECVFWLNYGTLLGAYRDHDFITHDNDLDIGMYWKDREGVKEWLADAGLKLLSIITYGNPDAPDSAEYRFEYHGTCIDINFYEVETGVAITYNPLFFSEKDYNVKGASIPVKVERVDSPFTNLKKITVLGRKFYVPENTEEYLIANYGENFMTPISDFNYHDYALNITAYSEEEKSGSFYRYNF